MRTDVYVRSVAGYGSKLRLDRSIADQRRDLDRWSFGQGMYVSHAVFGSLQSGFHEFVSVTARRAEPAAVAAALERADQTARVALEERPDAPPPRPRGFAKLLLADQDFGPGGLNTDAYVLLRDWKQLLPRAVTDTPQIATTERIDDGGLAVMGRMWHLRTLDLRTYLTARLAELVFGSTEPGAVLRPLRDSGDVYAAFARHLYDLGVLVVAVLGAHSENLAGRTQGLIEAAQPTARDLTSAKGNFWFQFRLGESSSSIHALAPYALIDPTVTASGLEQLLDSIELHELTAVLASQGRPIRKMVNEHGLV